MVSHEISGTGPTGSTPGDEPGQKINGAPSPCCRRGSWRVYPSRCRCPQKHTDAARLFAMDIAACAVTSLLGRFAWMHLEGPLSQSSPLPSVRTSTVFFAFFSVQYAIVKTYRLFVYPYFRSPLRKLPGPKVIPQQPPPLWTLGSLQNSYPPNLETHTRKQ